MSTVYSISEEVPTEVATRMPTRSKKRTKKIRTTTVAISELQL